VHDTIRKDDSLFPKRPGGVLLGGGFRWKRRNAETHTLARSIVVRGFEIPGGRLG